MSSSIRVSTLVIILVVTILLSNQPINAQTCSTYYRSCARPNCPSGFTRLFETSELPAKRCDQRVLTGRRGGIIRCAFSNPIIDSHSGCRNGTGSYKTVCQRHKTCSELTGGKYPHRFNDSSYPLSSYVFIKDPNDNADASGYSCGLYKYSSPPQWQAAGGNVYASGSIQSNYANSKPVIRTATSGCPNSANTTAGIQITGQSSSGSIARPYSTQRSTRTTSAYTAFTVSATNKEDYNFYRGLIGNISTNCNAPSVLDGYQVCQTGSTNLSNLTNLSSKSVVFVNGNLTINTTVSVPNGGFKAFIVSGTITVNSNVGTDHNSAPACPSASNADLQGVYIANSLNFARGSRPDTELNPDAYCERQVSFGGIVNIWSGNLTLPRTFKGCNLNLNYQDFNATKPAHAFIYRPDLLLNAPNWMRKVISIRTEEI